MRQCSNSHNLLMSCQTCVIAQVYGLVPDRIWVSVYEQDEEAYAIWRDSIGVPPSRIQRLGAADNFWESGPTGTAISLNI